VTHRKAEKERQLSEGREARGAGGGARSYDGEKSWSSISHSIVSVGLVFDIPTSFSGLPAFLLSLSTVQYQSYILHQML
jgi:hypothetical protein